MGICKDTRDCFGKKQSLFKEGNIYECVCLDGETYEDGLCPFCKPEVDVTKGKRYPYDPYAKRRR